MTNTFNRNDGTFAQVATGDLSGSLVSSIGGLTGAVTIGAGLTTSGGTLNTTSVGFYAHKNGSTQTINNGAYTVITFGTEGFDRGSYYDTGASKWTPPAGLVVLGTQILITSHLKSTGNPTCTCKIFKNGTTDVSAGVGSGIVGFAGTGTAKAITLDVANGIDYYQVEHFADSDDAGNDIVVDGNAAHTYFWGAFLGA